ncbi:MarR family transcriptional regulator [Nocardiopsis sp. RSe5-2]|uniref:MarR family transcriptional regulator n=1 Tax=Nocardiopsis endophytica TaxID=3018445 RepID=A0ABT4U5H7_9ACTN|nr:MarR family transcriptional regulator [Nocardiopsis endophytica]MDA2812198.1 MarR family transcriptional regulator [Nocardiopsis endophytica]
MAIDADTHKYQRERLEAVIRSMQRDTVPSLVRVNDDEDLSLIEMALLQTLDHDRPPFPGDPPLSGLAEVLGRSTSRTSRVVDRMVRRGLVERYEDAADRRVRRVRLTDAGREVLDGIARVRMEAQTALWDYLTAEELEAVVSAMELLAEAAHRMRSERDARGRPE